MSDLNPQTTELLLAGAVAFAMLVQAIVVLATFLMVRKTIRILRQEISETRVKATVLLDKAHPIIENAQQLVANARPKIESAVSDLAAVTQKLRAESEDVQKTTHDIVERVRHQGMRIDSMTTKTLDAVDRAAGFVTDAMGKPMRQLSAILASAKAVVESLRTTDGHARPHVEHATKGSKGPDYYA